MALGVGFSSVCSSRSISRFLDHKLGLFGDARKVLREARVSHAQLEAGAVQAYTRGTLFLEKVCGNCLRTKENGTRVLRPARASNV